VSHARLAALLFGGFWLVVGLLALLAPARFRAGLAAFPRNKPAGWVLATVVVCWSSFKLYGFPMEFYQRIRTQVAVLTPVYLYGLIRCLPDLLAARMLAGLMLLCSEPLLDAIRWQDSPLRLLIVVVDYVLIVACMYIAVSPFKFRHWTAPVFSSDARAKAAGGALAVYGAAVVGIGLFAFT
jgi:hypothetical protein